MGRIVAGKLQPLLQTQAVIGRQVPGFSDPLEITGETSGCPEERVITLTKILIIWRPECAELVITVSQTAQ